MAYTPERLSVFETIQMGKEATPGTAVAATLRPQSISIVPTIAVETSQFRPAGKLVNSVVAVGKDTFTGSVTVQPCYEEVGQILGSAIATNSASSGAAVYSLNLSSPNTPDTWTVEFGSGSNAKKASMCTFTGFNFTVNAETSVEMTSEMFGGQLVAATATTGLSAVDVTPIQAQEFTLSIAGSSMTRAFKAELGFTGHWAPVRAIGAPTTGFVNLAEAAPQATLNLTLEANTQGEAMLAAMRAGNATKKVVLSATNSKGQSITFEMGVKVIGFGAYEDNGGVYAYVVNCTLVEESTLGTALKVTVAS